MKVIETYIIRRELVTMHLRKLYLSLHKAENPNGGFSWFKERLDGGFIRVSERIALKLIEETNEKK